jgi:hypothetical protein
MYSGGSGEFAYVDQLRLPRRRGRACVICTEWQPYRRPDFERMRSLLAPVIFDGRNIYSPDKMREEGSSYHSVGTRPRWSDSAGAVSARIVSRMTVLVTGRRRLPGLSPVRALPRRRARGRRRGQLHHGQRENIAHLEVTPGFTLHRARRVEAASFPDEGRGVLHFASPASPVDYLELPIQTLKVGSSVRTTRWGWPGRRGRASCSLPRPRSTAIRSPSAAGDYWGHVNPVGPRGVYDEAKRFAEAMTMAYHRAPRGGYAHRADLQHLRPAHAPR